jgi:hypothetical protein
VSTGTKLFLLLGCAIVVALEAPATLASLVAGWRGPYSRPAVALARPLGSAQDLAVPLALALALPHSPHAASGSFGSIGALVGPAQVARR